MKSSGCGEGSTDHRVQGPTLLCLCGSVAAPTDQEDTVILCQPKIKCQHQNTFCINAAVDAQTTTGGLNLTSARFFVELRA